MAQLKIGCFDDRKGWGSSLAREARVRGHFAWMFKSLDGAKAIDGNFYFMRICQEPNCIKEEKRIARQLWIGGKNLIPSIHTILEYESKILQSIHYGKDWMPRTEVIETSAGAKAYLENATYPFISKGDVGSASDNVRLVENREQAEFEIQAAFGEVGIPSRFKPQKGYLIWQDFCKGNEYDYRVIAIGRRRLLLRRFNRDDRPMASGSGKLEAITQLDGETESALAFANSFFEAYNLTWSGIDLVRSGDKWVLLETTLAWTLSGYKDCVFFGPGSPATGENFWRVVVEEIENGGLK